MLRGAEVGCSLEEFLCITYCAPFHVNLGAATLCCLIQILTQKNQPATQHHDRVFSSKFKNDCDDRTMLDSGWKIENRVRPNALGRCCVLAAYKDLPPRVCFPKP